MNPRTCLPKTVVEGIRALGAKNRFPKNSARRILYRAHTAYRIQGAIITQRHAAKMEEHHMRFSEWLVEQGFKWETNGVSSKKYWFYFGRGFTTEQLWWEYRRFHGLND